MDARRSIARWVALAALQRQLAACIQAHAYLDAKLRRGQRATREAVRVEQEATRLGRLLAAEATRVTVEAAALHLAERMRHDA